MYRILQALVFITKSLGSAGGPFVPALLPLISGMICSEKQVADLGLREFFFDQLLPLISIWLTAVKANLPADKLPNNEHLRLLLELVRRYWNSNRECSSEKIQAPISSALLFSSCLILLLFATLLISLSSLPVTTSDLPIIHFIVLLTTITH